MERGKRPGPALIEKYIPEGANWDVYICGNLEMVESCLEAIKEKAFLRTRYILTNLYELNDGITSLE